MANFSMPWVQADFDRKTLFLTRLQANAYRALLQACFDAGGELPDDDKRLSQICDLDVRTWRKHRSAVLAFFYLSEGGHWRQTRIDHDLTRLADLHQKRSLAGKKGVVARLIKQARRR
jgi:uncharacterized protein YdaU (DUF1376 family)